MDTVLSDLLWPKMMAYLDDIIVCSETMMSSRYTITLCHRRASSTVSIRHGGSTWQHWMRCSDDSGQQD